MLSIIEGNHSADFLAKMGPSAGTWFREVLTPPLGMHKLILADAMNLPFTRVHFFYSFALFLEYFDFRNFVNFLNLSKIYLYIYIY